MNMIPGGSCFGAVGYRPACLSRDSAALTRELSRRRGQNIGGFELRVVAPPDQIAEQVAFDLTLGGHAARVTLPRGLLHRLLEQLDPAAPGAAPDAAVLLLELALEPLLTGLETRFPSLAAQLRPAADAAVSAVIALGLEVRQGAMAHVLRLDLDLAVAGAVAAALARLPDQRGALPDLPVWLCMRAHSLDVTLAELDALRPGDVILPDSLPDREILVVAGERFVWRARRDGSGLHVVSSRLRPEAIGLGGWVMGNTIDADDMAGLDELPVRLSFELGRLELPLAEVAVLGPGHVFELAREEAQPVDILANGRRLGRGRIVIVGQSIGVQIVRIGRE
jgi:type III secretion protein Q